MKTSRCQCGNPLFFDSTQCVACRRDTGFCPNCRSVQSIETRSSGVARGNCSLCRTLLQRCHNYEMENVCNAFVPQVSESAPVYCEYCRLTDVIPDLSVAGNRERWNRLEAAKRRVLAGVESIGIDLRRIEKELPLSFEFKADGEVPVMTGHASGVITINVREADDVEREKSRVAFGEPQRTLVGHVRHELGHYFWERFVTGPTLERFRAIYGDESRPTYQEAREAYYNLGPPDDWPARYLSAYCTMHPWEDFAETFAAYLDLRSILDTADDFGLAVPPTDDFLAMLRRYQRFGLLANEWNRDIGLLDLVPEVFVGPVAEKMEFVHELLKGATVKTVRDRQLAAPCHS